jgi:zinc protease
MKKHPSKQLSQTRTPRPLKPSLSNPPKTEHLIGGIDPYDFKTTEHKGAHIYSKEVPWANCIYVRFLFNAGSRHDPKGREGVMHFMEHMLFSSTPTHPTKFDIDQFSKTHTLDSFNAFTSFSHMCLNYRCLEESFEGSLKGAIEVLTSSLLTKESFEKERNIIIQEAWSCYKNAKNVEYRKKTKENVYASFPDRLRAGLPLGWPESIEKITHADIRAYYKKFLVRENLSVVVGGNISKIHLNLIKKYIEKIPSGVPSKGVLIPKNIKPPKERIWIYTYEEMGLTPNNQVSIELSNLISRIDKSYSDEAGYLTRALMYELMFQELRHKNSWCYGVQAGFGNYEDFSYGSLSSKIDAKYVNEAFDIIQSIIQNVLDDKHIKEFEQEKTLFMQRKRAVELSTNDLIDNALYDLRCETYIQTNKNSYDELYKVTYEDIKQVLKSMFTESNSVMYEASVPNDYDKSISQNYLKKYIK